MVYSLGFSSSFHNVGQGLFYSGIIGRSFNFVYDCGSLNEGYLKKSIKQYKTNNLKGKVLDLLIISHFHKDHINGVEELLKGVKVHTVVIPYMPFVERLLLWVANKFVLSEIILNPVQYFVSKGAKRIIIIGGKGDLGPNSGSARYIDPEPPSIFRHPDREVVLEFVEEIPGLSADDLDLSALPVNDELKKRVLTEYQIEDLSSQVDLLTCSHLGYVTLKKNWLFRFYNKSMDGKLLKQFKTSIEKKLGIRLSEGYKLKEKIGDFSNLNAIRECYEDVFGSNKLNNTSLVVFHSPINYHSMDAEFKHIGRDSIVGFHRPKYLQYYTDKCIERNLLGQMITGDISLRNTQTELKPFLEHYRAYKDYVRICLIPHHGSKNNWNTSLTSKLSNCSYWVASAGFSNKYGHPSLDVFLDIEQNEQNFSFCSEIFQVNCEARIVY